MEADSGSRDLLHRFAGISTISGDPTLPEASELSLGLSLGGEFSSNPREKTSLLIRSASISSFPNLISSIVKGDDVDDKNDITNLGEGAATQLKRTCSMPVPGAEDYRKKKVLQTLKRLEAKRKRHEKRISCGGGGGGGGLPPLSHGSGRSSSSSGGGPMQGIESTSKQLERRASGTGELEMPCVSTRGSGPNGKRIEGFLYRYGKGKEVRIVCVCHGNFLTPAEFVRHAGGGEVDHPMRHIVVNTSPSPFL